MKHFKISLKAARVNAELTQEQAAKKLGISPATIKNYESGATVPNWDIVRKIEKTYGMKAEYIFFGNKSALSEQNDPDDAA